jgi:hypothetical protein
MVFEKMIQVSMEFQHVNWSFLSKLEQELIIELIEGNLDPQVRFELESCGLHVSHGTFRRGHDAIGWKF